MSVKEELIELMQAEGFDFISACEEYERIKSEIKPGTSGTYWLGRTQFTLSKGDI